MKGGKGEEEKMARTDFYGGRDEDRVNRPTWKRTSGRSLMERSAARGKKEKNRAEIGKVTCHL